MSAHSRYAPSISKSLYDVFVLPNLPPRPALHAPASLFSRYLQRSSAYTSQSRGFSFSSVKLGPPRPNKTRQKWDEEITAKMIYLIVDNKKDPEPRTRWDVLRMYDKTTHRLMQLTPDEPRNPDFMPICKIIDKKEEYAENKRKKQEKREQAKAIAKEGVTKTLEVNWAIDPHMLLHRLGRIEEFLSQGMKVEMVFAAKKRGRKASAEECAAFLEKIAKTVDSVPGAKQHRNGLQGRIGGFATLTLEGKAQTQQGA